MIVKSKKKKKYLFICAFNRSSQTMFTFANLKAIKHNEGVTVKISFPCKCKYFLAFSLSSSVQSLRGVWFIVTPCTAETQASLSITNFQSLLKLVSIESVIPSNNLILCYLLPPAIFPSIMVFSNKSALHIRWPKYWSFSPNISPANEYQDWFHLGLTGWISLQCKGPSRVFSNTTVQKHQFFGTQLSI